MNTKMSTETLLETRFDGERFKAHSLPISLLRDLEALQGVVQETAKALYRERNPSRKRIPRGLSSQLDLHIVATEEGSFIAKVGIVLNLMTFFPQNDLHVTLARESCEKITQLIGAATSLDSSPLPSLPPSAMRYLERFGQGLQEGESISLGQSKDGKPAILTPEVRRRILMAPPNAPPFHENVRVVGRLTGIRVGATVTIRLMDDREIDFSLDPGLFEERNEISFHDITQGTTWVQVAGVGRFDHSQKLLGLDEISLLERIDEHTPQVQLAKLRVLQDGWLDGLGKAPLPTTLDRISAWFDAHLSEDSPPPRVYPTPEGGIEAEWLIGRLDISIEFDPVDGRVEWHALNLDSNAVDERSYRFTDASDMYSLGAKLTQVLSEGHLDLNDQGGEGQ